MKSGIGRAPAEAWRAELSARNDIEGRDDRAGESSWCSPRIAGERGVTHLTPSTRALAVALPRIVKEGGMRNEWPERPDEMYLAKDGKEKRGKERKGFEACGKLYIFSVWWRERSVLVL